MDPAQKLQQKTQRVTAFVEPSLDNDEQVAAVLALGVGPLSPLTTLIPFVGVLLHLTRWIRAYAVVLTNKRCLLVRCRQYGQAIPRRVDASAPLGEVRVVSWTARRSAALLKLDLAGRRVRLHIVGEHHLQMPPLLEKLGYSAS